MESLGFYGVDFSYREKGHRGPVKQILKGANLSIEQGDIVCVCGKSGQGKSTILRIMAGLERPHGGRILYSGVESEPEHHTALRVADRGVGFVFQNCALISNLRVIDNVALPLRYHQRGDEPAIQQRVNQLLDSMMVEEYANQFPYAISVGAARRVAIARALALDPRVLLMDEPTAGLDSVNRRSLLALIGNLRALRHVTIIIVTHDLLMARELNSRICFLQDGFISPPVFFEELPGSPFDFVREMVRDLATHEEQLS